MKNKNDEHTIKKYMTIYMLLGMCFGMPIETCIGMVIGQAKDKRLLENMMIIRKIETINNSSDMVIHASNKNEICNLTT